MSKVNPIPDGYPRVMPYLSVDDAAGAIDFYSSVLGAKERSRMPGPEGKIAHAEIEIGDSVIMLSDPMPGMSAPTPRDLKGTPVGLMIYVEDVDQVFASAIKAGAKSVSEPSDQFYGDRMGMFEDPYGHMWNVGSHIEDLTEEEIGQRMQAQGG